MYQHYFGLKHEPFSIAPDSRFLFMSARHREALAHLLYGLDRGGGFVLLTGEIGAGKTTVCRRFLKQIPPHCNVAYVLNPKCTVIELLKTVCSEFGIEQPQGGPAGPTAQDYIDALNQFLLEAHAQGQSNLLIIDEAQNLAADVLEQLRLLTNLETDDRKLLQILLIGQPELREMLARPELEQLAQRVIARYHLKPLSRSETEQYIRFRLKIAGRSSHLPFNREARERIHQLTGGVPRRINLLCDRALLAAYGKGVPRVDRALIDSAAREVFHGQRRRPRPRMGWNPVVVWSGIAAAIVVFGIAALIVRDDKSSSAPPALPQAQAAPAVSGKVRAPTVLNPAHGVPAANAAATPPAASPAGAPAGAVAPVPPASVAAAPTAAGAVAPQAAAVAGALPPATAAAVPLSMDAAELKVRFPVLYRSESDAWRELATLWNLPVGSGDPCQAAIRQDVHCAESRTDLGLVRQLDRPGIVKLFDENNRPVHVLLVGLGSQSATLRMGNVSHTVSLVSLVRMWRGDFATYWRAPPGYIGRVGEGASGPVVEHLLAHLTAFDGVPPPAGVRRYTSALKSRVLAFQLAQGLEGDGIAGANTFMQLNRINGVDEPRLRTER